MTELEKLGAGAVKAANFLNGKNSEYKNLLLKKIAEKLLENKDLIIEENKKDIENAKNAKMPLSMQDRLLFTEERLKSAADGVLKVMELNDPVGEVLENFERPNGLKIEKRRVPLGVIGVIYEARPNVTIDTAVLCLKASNAVILRGGKEAFNTNKILADTMRAALKSAGADENIISFVTDTSRESATEMMRLNGYIDVLIPRGGAGLINACVKNATVPVIETGVGNCHIFADESADVKKAVDIIINAKTSRPSVCNAAETLLIHKDIDKSFFSSLNAAFLEKDVKVIGCEKCKEFFELEKIADEKDFATEFLAPVISVKIVDNIDEAIEHISKYSTKHSECIITQSTENAEKFTSSIDAAAVYVNASTRFTDGFEFGFGAEIGISTQKLHARGPMGLRELTSYKYVISGDGQIR